MPVESLLRELAPQVLGALLRRFRDFAGAEDAVQEALVAAVARWPVDGMPDDPRAWLIRVAFRRMTDHLRGEIARRRREELAAAQELAPAAAGEVPDGDDTLVLYFLCCHPVLTPASAIALTLRAVGGLTTAEIAKAFLVPEATMAQRISRAKRSIKDAGAELRMPERAEWAARLDLVLHVLYLIFNEGYASSAGPALQRPELTGEAIRLTRALRAFLAEDREVAGLLALMVLTDARRAARTDDDGALIPLAEQDRSRWDAAAISEGIALITETLAKGSVGPYQIQAAIAAIHDEAASAEETDWTEILALYGLLERMTDNPIVRLNRAIAAAMVHGAPAGLKLLDEIEADGRLRGHHRLDAVRAHLLEMAEDIDGAIACYRAAASKTTSIPEQRYLTMRAARLAAGR